LSLRDWTFHPLPQPRSMDGKSVALAVGAAAAGGLATAALLAAREKRGLALAEATAQGGGRKGDGE
jgi:hypothetical protein